MIIMTLDHVRDYFHHDAFVYSPTDLEQTNVLLFFTRFITHYCAPVFVFLAGISAYLYGAKRSKKELSFFLLTRGIWLVLIELFIVSLFRTFNPLYTFNNLQVIWAIGISMMVLAGFIYLNLRWILVTGILLIAAHNALDSVHVPGNSISSFLWALLHEPRHFTFGNFTVYTHYPLIPWIGIMLTGYYFGSLYTAHDAAKRRKLLLFAGTGALLLFIVLRSLNIYGDANHWSTQKDAVFTVLSFLNVTKYPPSLLYILVTVGPACIFLALAEQPNAPKAAARMVQIFGRAPMFFYLAHILLIHILAIIAAVVTGFKVSDMILSTGVNSAPALKHYGFSLLIVYVVWITVLIMLYPLCKWFDRYKSAHGPQQPWLSYF